MTDRDTEMALVRALEQHGVRFSSSLTLEQRREHIRVSILSRNLETKRLGRGPNGQAESYSTAWARCFDSPLELRSKPREPYQYTRPFFPPVEDPVDSAASDSDDADLEDV